MPTGGYKFGVTRREFRQRALPLVRRDMRTVRERLRPHRRADFGEPRCNPGMCVRCVGVCLVCSLGSLGLPGLGSDDD